MRDDRPPDGKVLEASGEERTSVPHVSASSRQSPGAVVARTETTET